MMTDTRKVGRPTKEPVEGERVMLGLRVTPDVKRKLDEAAKAQGRSQSQEAEMRLTKTFDQDQLLQEIREVKARLLALIAKSEAEDK